MIPSAARPCPGLLTALFALLAVGWAAASETRAIDLERYRATSEKRFEATIAELETLDGTDSHPAEAVLFIGSSSIRLWKDIASDLAPYHPIQRGFGGSRWSDVAVFADRLIKPHRFRAVVFFVGNDITGTSDDKTPGEVAALFEHVLARVREHQPAAAVFYVAVTPSLKRWEAWSRIKEANTAARAVCGLEENAWFIGTESVFLDAEGQPRPELFLEDRLHLSREGYILWAAAIKSHLDSVLGGAGGGRE